MRLAVTNPVNNTVIESVTLVISKSGRPLHYAVSAPKTPAGHNPN